MSTDDVGPPAFKPGQGTSMDRVMPDDPDEITNADLRKEVSQTPPLLSQTSRPFLRSEFGFRQCVCPSLCVSVSESVGVYVLCSSLCVQGHGLGLSTRTDPVPLYLLSVLSSFVSPCPPPPPLPLPECVRARVCQCL